MRPLVLTAFLFASTACSEASSEIGSPKPADAPRTNAPFEAEPAAAPREVPQGTFTGVSNGCSNLIAYRGSADRTQYAVVQLDKSKVGVEIGSAKEVDLGDTPEGVDVFVDIYASALDGETPYCTDYRTETPAMTRWKAQAGKLRIELAPDPTSSDATHPTYRATLRLETVHLVGPDGGFAVVVPSVVIEDVRVGWLPG
jgi:hypothetical protein